MSEANRPRRVLAEIRWANDPGAIVWVGSRTIHQYWPLLSGYFRDILLPPHRRAEDSSVSWSWREPPNSKPPTPSELSAIRKRLTGDHALFAENLTRGLGSSSEASGLRGQGNIDELGAAMAAAVSQLVAHADDELARFVCRTESGLRVHCWGAPVAATLVYPDTEDREISGHVVAKGKPAARHAVLLEGAGGELAARLVTDGSGLFRFQKVAPGDYRLTAEAPGGTSRFPSEGLPVTIARESVTGIILRDGDASPMAVPRHSRNWPRWALVAAIAAIFVTAIVWGVKRWTADSPVVARGPDRGGELNSSQATAPKTTNAVDPSARPKRSPGADRDAPPARATAASGVAASTLNSSASISPPQNSSLGERNVVQPGSHLLPGAFVATPVGDAAMPVSPTGPSQSAPAAPGTAAGTGVAGATQLNSMPSTSSAQAAPNVPPERGEQRKQPAESQINPPRSVGALQAARAARAVAAPSSHSAIEPPNSPSTEKPARDETSAPPPEVLTLASEAPADATPPDSAAAVMLPAAESGELAHAVSSSSEPEPSSAAASSSEVDPAPRDTGSQSNALDASSDSMGRPALVLVAERWLRVRVAPWRVRLMRDVVLPTRPVRADQDEGIPALREQLLADRAGQMPRPFREPRMGSGLIFESAGAAELTWHDENGRAPKDAWTHGARAVISLDRSSAMPGAGMRVVRGEREVIAELRCDGSGWTFRSTAGVRVWQWFALEVGEAVRADSRVDHATLSWKTGSGLPLPTGWSQHDYDALGTGGRRQLLVPIEHTRADAVYSLALVDEQTGWGVLGDVRVFPEAR